MLLVRINRNLSLPHRQRFPRVTATVVCLFSYGHFYRPIYPRLPPSPFPQRQHFPRSGAVADSRWDNDTSHSACQEAVTGYSCHNGSNLRDSMPLRYMAKRKRPPRCGCRKDVTKNANSLLSSRLLRNFDYVHIYRGASAVQIEQVHLHRSRLLCNLDYVHIYWGASAVQIEQVHLHCSRLLRIFTA